MRSGTPPLLLAALATPGAVCLIMFLLLPLGIVAAESLAGGGAGYARLAARPEFWGGLRNTFALGVTAGLISVAVGFAVALHLSRMPEARRAAFLLIISLPLTFSGLVVAFGFILAWGRAGFFTLSLQALFGIDPASFARFVYSPHGLAFVYAYYLIPRVVMLLLPVLVNFDRAQLAAAESLGATQLRALASILLPQIAPTALVAFCLVVAVAFGAYGTALALVGSGQVNILPLQLFAMVSDAGADWPETAALALFLTALCSVVMAAGEVVSANREERD
ncbi:MAG: ABC transporter permease [Acetobacteraceae bacterium]|jgi:putative spermidine/putrescine transport system permease protein|nr:ABC transporter permease [Acetobacteraceae bacterium]